MRFAAGLIAAALAVTALPQDVVSAAGREPDPALSTGGLMEFVTEQAEHVSSDDTSDHTYETNTLRSIRPELRQYDWDCYSNDYYYSKLSAKEQLLYERLDAVCGELLTSPDVNAETYKPNGNKRRGTKEVSTLGLSTEQVKKVQALFVYANPQYYFLNTMMLLIHNDAGEFVACALGMYDKFADGAKRARETELVEKRLKELQGQVSDNGVTFETEAQIHELLCDELAYMSGYDVQKEKSDPYYTQSIYGALISGETQCAGYTKLYGALCNYYGIDCIVVTHTDEQQPKYNHGWNEVRYGDHWYIVDVTWDDTRDRAKFFHITDQRMTATDQNHSHVPYSYYEGIRPVADAEFSEELKTMPGLAQPQVEIKDTAPGVMITMTAEAGDVYYTLDGTLPGESDRYTQPIELTDGGTYIVTAMTAGEGAVPSAYEIFPVRIAGGRVSVSSAVNVTGKKIRVKFKAAKNFAGYEISYASKKDFSNQKSAKVKGKSAVISGLKKGKTYYIRVRGFKTDVHGNNYYTPYSKMRKVTITK